MRDSLSSWCLGFLLLLFFHQGVHGICGVGHIQHCSVAHPCATYKTGPFTGGASVCYMFRSAVAHPSATYKTGPLSGGASVRYIQNCSLLRCCIRVQLCIAAPDTRWFQGWKQQQPTAALKTLLLLPSSSHILPSCCCSVKRRKI